MTPTQYIMVTAAFVLILIAFIFFRDLKEDFDIREGDDD